MQKYSIPIPPKPCEVCGTIFDRNPREPWLRFFERRSCSTPCRVELLRRTRREVGIDPPRVQIVCEICGKHFECRKSSAVGATGSIKRFCSRTCQGLARRRTDWSYPTPKQIEFVCPICGSTKIGWKNYHPKTCSFRCAALQRAQAKGLLKPTIPERMLIEALSAMGVACESQAIVYPYVVDVLIPDKNLVIECLGDYVHCNPAKYPNGPIDDRQRTAVAKDAIRFASIREKGYLLLTFWERDIKGGEIRSLLEGAI